jgi:DNA replication initiation complex subunit (GINS family)
MNIKRDYEKLYQHWLKEFQNTELTDLNQHLFEEYKKIINFVNDHRENQGDILRFQIFEAYKNNFNYLFADITEIREKKIINSALALMDIDLSKVTEAEKLLYQNLISSIKGYRKVKALSDYEEEYSIKSEEITKSEPVSENIESGTKEVSVSTKISKIPSILKNQEQEEIEYILLRFIEDTPSLVGIDLINYGPFKKEDIAFIPSQNANILIFEKYAQKIEIT